MIHVVELYHSIALKKKKNWFTDELKKIKNEIIELRFNTICTAPVLVEIKQLKKKFKKIMKKNIYLYEKNEFYKIDKIIRERNSSSFFNKVNRIKDNNKNIISVSFETLISHYDNIFNEKINVEESIIHEINSGISDLSILNFKNIDLNESELVSALNDTNNSNVCGNDGISNSMILSILI